MLFLIVLKFLQWRTGLSWRKFDESEKGRFSGFWDEDGTKVIISDTQSKRLQIYDLNANNCYQYNIISEFDNPKEWFYYQNGIVADGKYYRLSLT